jgi:hypothetical protein
MEVFIVLIITIYLIYSIRLTKLIEESAYLNHKQKRVNTVLLWIIPFIWGYLIKNIIKPSKPEIMTKSKRKINKDKNTDNWQNLTGYGG